MRALITGIGGFVGKYLRGLLITEGLEVYGFERNPTDIPHVIRGDITDAAAVEQAVLSANPDLLFHLAGFSSVEKSFAAENLVRAINVGGTRNILAAARQLKKAPRILIISSSEAYGKPVANPVPEDAALNPLTPYGKSRVEQENVVHEFRDLPVIISRSFNHTGPGQSASFVVPSFAQQVAEVEAGKRESVRAGNLEPIRDFTDVRDMVRWYWLLIQKGVPGETYNLGRGEGVRIGDILTLLAGLVSKPIRIEPDPKLKRPADVPAIWADTRKAHACTSWRPEIPLLQTLEDTLDYWRQQGVGRRA